MNLGNKVEHQWNIPLNLEAIRALTHHQCWGHL